jgi:hypothetical protein
MGDWQEELYREVGLPLGLVKERPKELQEKRLSRREERIIIAAKETSILIQAEAKEKSEKIVTEAKEKMNEAKQVLQEAKSDAEGLVETGKKEVIKITSETQDIKDNAWNVANDITKAAEKKLEDAKNTEAKAMKKKTALDETEQTMDEGMNTKLEEWKFPDVMPK